MRYLSVVIVMVLSVSMVPTQTTQPALPAGHPDIAALRAAATQPSLPSGHPSIPGMSTGSQPSLPSGHPSIPGMSTGSQPSLPSGHPSIPGMSPGSQPGLPAGHPEVAKMPPACTQPTETGMLEIHMLQGTRGAKPIGAEPINVDLYHEGEVIHKVQATLDTQGVAIIKDLPLAVWFQPVVRIKHAGVEHEGVGNVMDAMRRGQRLRMTVYESTEQEPAWQIKMRHLMVKSTPQGLSVTDMLSIDNPSDRSWIGTRGTDGKHTTLAVPLPPGARDVQLVGDHGEVSGVANGKFVVWMPLLPGATQFQLQYLLPVANGRAELTVSSPVAVGRVMVFAPNDGSTVTVTGLEEMGVRKMGEASTRSYKAADLKPGQELKLVFSGLSSGEKKTSAGGSYTPQIIAGVGGGVILLGGVTVLFIKAPKHRSSVAERRGSDA